MGQRAPLGERRVGGGGCILSPVCVCVCVHMHICLRVFVSIISNISNFSQYAAPTNFTCKNLVSRQHTQTSK